MRIARDRVENRHRGTSADREQRAQSIEHRAQRDRRDRHKDKQRIIGDGGGGN